MDRPLFSAQVHEICSHSACATPIDEWVREYFTEDPYRNNASVAEILDGFWEEFRVLADSTFIKEFCVDPHARWWEMYLGVTLIRSKLDPRSADTGPDFKFSDDERTVHIEAVCPGRGQEGQPDTVPTIEMGKAGFLDRRKIILRLTSAINKKSVKFKQYINNGIVAEGDPCVISVSTTNVWRFIPDDYLVSTLYPMGGYVALFDVKTQRIAKEGYEFEDAIIKDNCSIISTDLFCSSAMDHISGILFCVGTILSTSSSFEPFGSNLYYFPNPTTNKTWNWSALELGHQFECENIDDVKIRIRKKKLY